MEDIYTINVTPKKGMARFGRRELTDIAVAMAVLSVAFMILFRNSGFVTAYFAHEFGSGGKWIVLFAMCFGLVFLSFLVHELGHKFVAQNYGMRSEFRMYPIGLLVTLITSAIGFLFAAPGAVYIDGYPDKKTNGLISIAGPATNIVLAAVGIAGCYLCNGTPAVIFFYMLTSLNSFLALFNMLPVPPLDGSKIVTWNIPIYIAAIGLAAVELSFIYVWGPDLYYLI